LGPNPGGVVNNSQDYIRSACPASTCGEIRVVKYSVVICHLSFVIGHWSLVGCQLCDRMGLSIYSLQSAPKTGQEFWREGKIFGNSWG
jgi:hypothetical protein